VNNPFGWILGFVWMLYVRVKLEIIPQGETWCPRWIQPYWMKCMGWELSDTVLKEFYKK